MQTALPRYEVVLLGVGHTNAHVLRMWRMAPPPDAHLTCVSNFPVVTYSGMLPGVLAGQYPPERMEIDLVRLCAAAGARLVVAEATGLDVEQRRLLFADRPPLKFDVLSIGIGSRPSHEGVTIEGNALLPIKPMQTFLSRFERRLCEIDQRLGKRGVEDKDAAGSELVTRGASDLHWRPLRVAVVGGGVGGVEIAFCLPSRVRKLLGERPLELMLVNAHDDVAGGVADKTKQRIRRKLEDRGVRLVLGRRVVRVTDDAIWLDNGEQHPVDIVLWATSAAAPPLLKKLGLPTDEDGFLLTHPTLQTVADAPIFAVGDTGTIRENPLPKAGVYAVREGPVLWENIRRTLAGEPLEPYKPQRGFMKLLNTGDGRALGDWKGWTFEGRWVWRLKDRIDGRFMDMYQDYRPMEMRPAAAPGAPEPMRCAGCGGKVGGMVLSRVLRRLDVPRSEHVLLGLEAPDDAAIVQSPGGRPMTVTNDFFAAPLDDPYITGRIAALNAASDAFALGARPLAVLAMATIPPGDPERQEELLYELLAGGLDEFRRMDAPLVGGHTIEGPQLTIGYTVLADQGQTPRTKGRLRAGDRLILTKPLGTGVLLAAHMRAGCRAAWMQALQQSMLLSNADAASLLDEFDIAAATDVTGFGLAGHLVEMLNASGGRESGVGSRESGIARVGERRGVSPTWLRQESGVRDQESGVRGQESGVRSQESGARDRDSENSRRLTASGVSAPALDVQQSSGRTGLLSGDGLAAELNLSAIPLLPGAEELLGEGVESTLAPANRGAEAVIAVAPELRRTPHYAALFDPQTSGGLLLAVPEERVEAILARLADQSDVPCAEIGRIVVRESGEPKLRLGESP